MVKDTGRRIEHIFAACFHVIDFRLKKLKKQCVTLPRKGINLHVFPIMGNGFGPGMSSNGFA